MQKELQIMLDCIAAGDGGAGFVHFKLFLLDLEKNDSMEANEAKQAIRLVTKLMVYTKARSFGFYKD